MAAFCDVPWKSNIVPRRALMLMPGIIELVDLIWKTRRHPSAPISVPRKLYPAVCDVGFELIVCDLETREFDLITIWLDHPGTVCSWSSLGWGWFVGEDSDGFSPNKPITSRLMPQFRIPIFRELNVCFESAWASLGLFLWINLSFHSCWPNCMITIQHGQLMWLRKQWTYKRSLDLQKFTVSQAANSLPLLYCEELLIDNDL